MESDNVLLLTLDSCRYDTFFTAFSQGLIPNLSTVGPLHKALAPSHFTYGSHAAFWMGFTPGVIGRSDPLLNPKAGKLFRMAFSGHTQADCPGFFLTGSNIVEGFKTLGYHTIGSGAVDWFNPATETGSVLGSPFDQFYFSVNTFSLRAQLDWIDHQLSDSPTDKNKFLFLNIGETHVPYWHEGADWPCRPSPCIPFGGDRCSASESARRQLACLEWVDTQLGNLLSFFNPSTILVCSDHGDCWGEDGLWEHGISHPSTLTVPLMMRLRGSPVF